MASEQSIIIVNQSLISRLYGVINRFNQFVDIFPIVCAVFLAMGMLILLVSLLGPPLWDLLTALGVAEPYLGRSFVVDAIALGLSSLSRSLVFLPVVVLALARDSIAMPFRSRVWLGIGIMLSVPAVIFFGKFLAAMVSGDTIGRAALTAGLYTLDIFMPPVSDAQDPAQLLVFAAGAVIVLSSFSILLAVCTTLFGIMTGKQALPRRRTRTSAGMVIFAAGHVFAALMSGTGRKMLILLVAAAVIGALTIQANRIVGVPVEWIVRWGLVTVGLSGDFASVTYGLLVLLLPFILVSIAGFGLSRRIAGGRATGWPLLIFMGTHVSAVWAFAVWREDASVFILPFMFYCAVIAVVPIARHIGRELRYLFRIAYLRAYRAHMGSDDARILFLRPFVFDTVVLRRRFRLVDWLLPLRGFTTRLEEVVAASAFRAAPLVALADPRETRPELGAIREYASDDDWQSYIAGQISGSTRILFIIGLSRHTGWETDRILEADAIGKTVFVLPPDRSAAVAYLRENARVADALHLDEDRISWIGANKVKAIFVSLGKTVIVVGRGDDEIDYKLAVDLGFERVGMSSA